MFDTAFLTTMPAAAYTYALPADLARKEGLRRYGAHGTSYRYLVGAAAKMLGRPAAELNMIIGHIGLAATACTPLHNVFSAVCAYPDAHRLGNGMSANVPGAQSRGWCQHVGSQTRQSGRHVHGADTAGGVRGLQILHSCSDGGVNSCFHLV